MFWDLLSQIVPEHRLQNFAPRVLVSAPVNGKDMSESGTTALSHCFTTKPTYDLEYAQILFHMDAGEDINNRNTCRYCVFVAHEIMLVYDPT